MDGWLDGQTLTILYSCILQLYMPWGSPLLQDCRYICMVFQLLIDDGALTLQSALTEECLVRDLIHKFLTSILTPNFRSHVLLN